MSKREKWLFLLIGGVGYGFIELLWRGYTHPSMVVAGGICFYFIGLIQKCMKGLNFLYKCILGSFFITAVELVFGLIFNIILKRNVWNYSNIKFNFLGQICLLYSVIWGLLTAAALPFCNIIFSTLQKKKKSV